ncbi:MAG: hypothetical protein ACT4OO_13245 [Nitrospiraceae bacterium]
MATSKTYLKLVKPPYTLIYGMRLEKGTLPEQSHPHIPVALPDGSSGTMALHVINGSVEEVKQHLLRSIEAFFEIYGSS